MNSKFKFGVALAAAMLAAIALLTAVFGLLWGSLSTAERDLVLPLVEPRIGILLVVGFFLFFILWMAVQALVRTYVILPRRLAEDLRVVTNVNPDHRAAALGPSEMRELAQAINALADHVGSLRRDVEIQIASARASVEEERNRLAALVSELAQGVLVCNIEGQILLYNNRARQVLAPQEASAAGGSSLVGLGRSVFGVVDRNLITHALETISAGLAQDKQHSASHFVTTSPTGALIRALMVPVLGQGSALTGFVLTLEDVTRALEMGSRRDELLQALAEGSRASLASIRAAVETLQSFPDMDSERQVKFITVIGDEAGRLSTRLDDALREHADALKGHWVLEDMLGEDLVAAAQRRIESRLGLPTKTESVDSQLWLKVDSFSIVQGLTYLAGRLQNEFDVREVRFSLSPAGKLANLDMIWSGTPVSVETLHTWENEPFNLGGEVSSLTLHDVVKRHGGEIWFQIDKASHRAYCRLLVPVSTAGAVSLGVRIAHDSRPEYYDFDLFHQPGQNPELDERSLSELAYTIFDTETTGLEPSAGDEIISIGAVRVVNNKLLRHEVFEQLIDPQRSMSRESIAIHGIQPEMLQGQPTIDRVLPPFHRFCEDTVLVAHNAAFDMRFLQIKEQTTGVRFTQPVLDTLLLSAVIHPNQEAHKLEAIATRLGVTVLGRHTAVGDAIVTGEVFLRMVPLLAERGIHTLKQAREAAEKTYYARIKY